MLSIGTLFKSPSSIRFRVLSCKFLDSYAICISGEEFSHNDAAPNVPTREMLREVDCNKSATNVYTREMVRGAMDIIVYSDDPVDDSSDFEWLDLDDK